MDDPIVSTQAIALLGLAVGIVFGAVGHRTNFCAMGAVSDIIVMEDWERMRMWMLAVGIAIVGVGLLQVAGLVDTRASLYAAPTLSWVSHILGGLAFGCGMALASGCTTRTLIRIGGGNWKSVVVFIVLAVSAYMTMRGLFAVWRVGWLDPWIIDFGAAQDLPTQLADAGGWSRERVLAWLPPAIGLGVAALCIGRWRERAPDTLLGGITVGLLVTAGWFVTGYIGFVPEHPDTLEAAYIGTTGNRPESLSLVAPFAETLELLMLWSDASRHVTFGIATALGIVAGAAASALGTGSFREESFPDAADLKRHLGGAVLMGFGGITALGCTVGQGLSGLSTLAIGSVLTTAAIIAGAAITIKFQYWRLMREA